MNYSVVIPTFHRPNSLLRLLHELLAQDDPPPFEIIVVDDSALPELKDAVAALSTNSPHRMTYMACAEEGPGQARNYGVSKAEGDFVVFLDDDCKVDAHWLRQLDQATAKSSADIYYGPVTSRSRSYEPFLQTVQLEDSPYRSNNIAFRKNLFLELGGFDPKLSYWSEGWDLVARARRQGAQLKYLSQWQCAHTPQYTPPHFFPLSKSRQMLEWMTYLMTQHRDSKEVQGYLNQQTSTAFWHTGLRISFFALPLLQVSTLYAFVVFMLLNLAYDSFRLMIIQRGLLKQGYAIGGWDALKYLAFNWTEDLRKVFLGIALSFIRTQMQKQFDPNHQEHLREGYDGESLAKPILQPKSH